MEVSFSPGMHIDDAAKKLCEVARQDGSAQGSFNEIRLSAAKTTTPETVVEQYRLRCEAATKAYRKSPEGIAAAERSNEDRRAKQNIHDNLMDRLSSLDWGSETAILDWLCEMQEPTDRIGVLIRKETIAATFAKHLYVPKMDCDVDYKKGDRFSEFRYLVGQALDGIVNGPAIHSILHKFTAEWKEKWEEK